MALARPTCGACSQPHQRRRLLGLTACIALLVVLAPWLRMVGAAAYAVAWWSLAPEVQWVRPGSVAAPAPAAAAAPVPKLMHQTWQTKQVPAKWAAARQSCIDLHPDFEHRLWTDEEGLAFVKKHYPWFLPTYVAYPYSIQRVDVLRYFLLHHYGGIYIDLDMGCNKRLDFMLEHNFTAPLTHPVGISNDVMAAVPGDAYLAHIVKRLASWNHWLFIKYIQVMFSTGPMFLTVQYSMFPNRADVGIIPADVYGKYDLSGDPVFYHLHGSSWHADDAQFVFWAEKHKTALLALGGLLAVLLAGLATARCLVLRQAAARYAPLKTPIE